MPCLLDASSETTLGYSATYGDCLCPEGSGLLDRAPDGALLPAKRCVRCAQGLLVASSASAAPLDGCRPCADAERMAREATGSCRCRQGFVEAGGACVSSGEFEEGSELSFLRPRPMPS